MINAMTATRRIILMALMMSFSALTVLWGSFFGSDIGGDNYKIAQKVIDPLYQNKIFWIKAEGQVSNVNEWTYYFYDPTTPKNARLVKIVNGKVDKVQAGEFKVKADESLVFDPSQNKVSTEQALQKVADFAKQRGVIYDSVKMELRRFSSNISPTWQINLYSHSHLVAGMNLNDVDGAIVRYKPAKTTSDKADAFFKDVENTFKGIGGDLEEFFTGERTVDQ